MFRHEKSNLEDFNWNYPVFNCLSYFCCSRWVAEWTLRGRKVAGSSQGRAKPKALSVIMLNTFHMCCFVEC